MVLQIFGNEYFGSKSEAGIGKAICGFKNLKVQMLPKFHFSNGFVANILKNLGLLRSVLGMY